MSFFSSDITRDKLIILYLLRTSGFELTTSQIARMAEDNKWDDYFSIQHAVAELHTSGLLVAVQRANGLCYAISYLGATILKEFAPRLPSSLRASIDEYVKANTEQVFKEAQHISSVEQIGPRHFVARMSMIENEVALLELSVDVPSKEAALTLCNRWTDKAPQVYRQVLDILSST